MATLVLQTICCASSHLPGLVNLVVASHYELGYTGGSRVWGAGLASTQVHIGTSFHVQDASDRYDTYGHIPSCETLMGCR